MPPFRRHLWALFAAPLLPGAPALAQLGPPCPSGGANDRGFQDDFGRFDCLPADAPLATDPENASGMSVCFGANSENNGYIDDISGWDFYNGQNDPRSGRCAH
jgi:hypothetical protein